MAPTTPLSTRLVLVVWGTLEILLFAGLIFGWASLVYVFKLEGYFSDICVERGNDSEPYASNTSYNTPVVHSTVLTNLTHEPATCKDQDKEFNLVYTLAVVINGVSLFATGWMFDKWGTRVCRLFGISTYLCGTLLTAFSTPATSLLLYPGIILLVFGGYFFIMTNFQLGNLIPSKRSTIISLYCGAYDSSAFMLVLVKFAYEAGISTRASFLFLSAMLSMVMLSTFWFMPRGRIPHPMPSGYKMRLQLPCLPSPSQPSEETKLPATSEQADVGFISV